MAHSPSILHSTMVWLILLIVIATLNVANAFVVPPRAPQSDNRVVVASTALDDMQKLIEKRLHQGPGALNHDEIATLDEAMSHIKEIDVQQQLRDAIAAMDTDRLTQLLTPTTSSSDGSSSTVVVMDPTTIELAFSAVVDAVEHAEQHDLPLPATVPPLLHHIFDADLHWLLTERPAERTNVTCQQPATENDPSGAARRMNYIFDDAAHKDLPLMPGRKCEGGDCCDACSRNIFHQFALDHETNYTTLFPQLNTITLNDLETVPAPTILQFVRLVERVRRTMAHEYGVPLATLLPLQAYARKYVAGMTQQGGGGGEGDFVTLHTDEATHSGYHYSCVLYLSTAGEDFTGGAFVFNDPAVEETTSDDATNENDDDDQEEDALLESFLRGELPEADDDDDLLIGGAATTESEEYGTIAEEIRRAGRVLTPFLPTRGSAVIFSSGWENMHEVEKITSGTRYVVPCFFTTCPVPEAAYEQMKVGKPKTNEDIADDWLHLLLAHRKESPMESVGRVKELLMKWHCMCTPLSQH